MLAVSSKAPTAVRPLIGLLNQMFDLVESLTPEQYARKPVGVVSSSIGGHVRHNLDHIEALMRGLTGGEINYDHRQRGTEIESNRLAALSAILRLEDDVVRFDWTSAPDELIVKGLVAPNLPAVRMATSLDRELAFVVSHTIHHNALIAVMVKLLGIEPPAEFGYAPSTIVHQRSRECVR